MKPIITVENVSKRYDIGTPETAHQNLREVLAGLAKAPLKQFRKMGRSSIETIWALKDVSFEVRPGEVVGIIGRNGAGKSTLLKILSRITEPTTGRIALYGRVGSLLEVGTGFHPELTGRENVYFNGAVLGMSRSETNSKFDEIIAFSEVEKFIDTPVKYYSSGMYMRLAFAVAAHLEPEILIVDEVLAVGDSAFQKKCLGKMGDVAKEGRTVLFVSHNMTAVKTLCERAIWLDDGEVMEIGETSKIALKYLEKGSRSILEQVWEDPNDAPGNERVRIHSARLRPCYVDGKESISIETPLDLEFEFWNYAPDAMLNFTMHLFTLEGAYVFATCSKVGPRRGALIKEVVKIPPNFLNDGIYNVAIQIVEDSTSLYYYPEILMFEVQDTARNGAWFGKWPGVVRPKLEWVSDDILQGGVS
jgi:lipopolysaccharide transport system ATP-binding protein